MRRALLALGLIVLALAGCNGDSDKSSDQNTENTQLGLFDWRRDPDTLVVRLDSRPDQESPAFLINSIPPCTVWGDGRVVWLTRDSSGAEEVLEARIDEAAVRAFIEDIISRGFYDWEDELMPPTTTDPVIETITLSLYDNVHTVRRFATWPQSSFTRVLEKCQALSNQPVRVQPSAGWVSAYTIPVDTMAPNWFWPANAPFTLLELAQNGEARWLEGNLAAEVWRSARQGRGDIQVVERGGGAYQVAIAVPGYSRDAAPPPSESGSSGS